MTTAEIVTSIQNWEAIRQDSAAMISFFGQGNCFSYDFPTYASSSSFIHVYPGIYNDQLYFFVIPSDYDNEAYGSDIDQYTTPCLVIKTVGDGRLTPAEAKARINAWEKNYPAWTTAQVGSQYGILEAFTLPTQDFEVESVIVTLGLKGNATATGGFQADLIVTNDEGKQVVYDDMAQPVPPFNALPAESEFYLLSPDL